MGTSSNSEDPDKMPHNATFFQGLRCLGHFIRVYTVCKGMKDLLTKNTKIIT